jgi:AcrR family transcriptional regulator
MPSAISVRHWTVPSIAQIMSNHPNPLKPASASTPWDAASRRPCGPEALSSVPRDERDDVSDSPARTVDGRSARRERNSDAVLDAAHALFVEHQQVPNVEDVAARAGVSLRSVYRYFPDTGQLMAAALERRTREVEGDWTLPHLGEGTLEERIGRFVDHRLFLYDSSGDTIRAAYALAGREPAIAGQVEARRSQVIEQTREHFAAEVDALAPTAAEGVLACVEALAQFESLELLRARQGMSAERTREVLVGGLTALLG